VIGGSKHSTVIIEPRAVHVFAHLAAIKEREARRLLKKAAATHGTCVLPNGDLLCSSKEEFAQVWQEAACELREGLRCAS